MVVALSQSRDREYVLLRNYRENIIARGFLTRLPFYALEQIENNSWYKQISDDEKPKVRSMIQIDIVSKIMMHIEDLAILVESFSPDRDFYELLVDENINLGDKTGKFIYEADSLKFKSLSQIMSYLDMEQISSDDIWRKTLKKHLGYHVEKIRNHRRERGQGPCH